MGYGAVAIWTGGIEPPTPRSRSGRSAWPSSVQFTVRRRGLTGLFVLYLAELPPRVFEAERAGVEPATSRIETCSPVGIRRTVCSVKAARRVLREVPGSVGCADLARAGFEPAMPMYSRGHPLRHAVCPSPRAGAVRRLVPRPDWTWSPGGILTAPTSHD